MPGTWFSPSARAALRAFRNTTRYTPVRIIHNVPPGTGSGTVSSFRPYQSGAESSYYRSGALGEMPGRSSDLFGPGGIIPSGRIRLTFDGLDTGADGNRTLTLVTGADSMYANDDGVEVAFEVHGVRYQRDGLTLVDATDEILIDAHAEEVP